MLSNPIRTHHFSKPTPTRRHPPAAGRVCPRHCCTRLCSGTRCCLPCWPWQTARLALTPSAPPSAPPLSPPARWGGSVARCRPLRRPPPASACSWRVRTGLWAALLPPPPLPSRRPPHPPQTTPPCTPHADRLAAGFPVLTLGVAGHSGRRHLPRPAGAVAGGRLWAGGGVAPGQRRAPARCRLCRAGGLGLLGKGKRWQGAGQ